MVEALGQVVNVTGQLEQKQAAQEQQIQAMMQLLDQTSKNATRRAQRMGAKQI